MSRRLEGLRRHLLPLFILSISIFVFLYLAQEMMESPTGDAAINSLDTRLRDFVISRRVEAFNDVFVSFTYMGSTVAVCFVTVVALVMQTFLSRKTDRRLLFVSVALIALTTRLSKALIQRARPPLGNWLVPASSYSFPSGHSAMAFAIYGTLFYLLARSCPKIWQRTLILMMGILFILTIGFSRIYLGVHFPSDVLGGFALGFAVLLMSYIFDSIRQHPAVLKPHA